MFRISCLCCPALLQLWPDCVFLVLRMKTHFIYNWCCLACRNHFVLHWFLKGKLWSAKNNCRNSPLFISLLSLTGRNFSGILCSGGIGDVPDQFVCSSGLPDHFWNQLVARCGCFPWIHERLCGCCRMHCVVGWMGVIPWQRFGQFYPCSSVLNSLSLCNFGWGWPKDLNQVY